MHKPYGNIEFNKDWVVFILFEYKYKYKFLNTLIVVL